ncbi:hypothetical protein [Nocardia sp. NPDC051463]|uniref:hypothetical protein n=1 Tax=Nocardia sp. NPDC051463 TaxID=3154845 RepID=UPI00342D1716
MADQQRDELREAVRARCGQAAGTVTAGGVVEDFHRHRDLELCDQPVGDKPAAFAEMARALTPGGHIGIADVVAEDKLTPLGAPNASAGSLGSLSCTGYRNHLAAAGFIDFEII